ncbi:MAG: GNAT family N-acetyltransferase [candidate division Zixibacteria bacterium]|nr:GNAT family N-acetyltransferase [candidate division Zixibacteria bacterium]
MKQVTLQPITKENYRECINLDVDESQAGLVASNAKSLAEAYVNPTLCPLGIYDVEARGWEKPKLPMVGFTMYELVAGVGFILRLMVDQKFQRQGYGKASMIEVIRRLRLHPEVELIATSHQKKNIAAASLYRNLGFKVWDIEWAKEIEDEVFLVLDGQDA